MTLLVTLNRFRWCFNFCLRIIKCVRVFYVHLTQGIESWILKQPLKRSFLVEQDFVDQSCVVKNCLFHITNQCLVCAHHCIQTDNLLEEIGLRENADTLSKDLSYGEKRKLCVGIALIGDPKVCNPLFNTLLEEPPVSELTRIFWIS